MHTCKNIGCNKTFKWRMQLSRHVLKCSKPVVDKTNQIVDTSDGYQCARCGRKYKFKENVYRHFKICKQILNYGNKEIINVNRDYRCFKCQRHFIRKEIFESHMKQCMPMNDQGVYVDTSNDENVVLVIPLDDNLLPHEDNAYFQTNNINNLPEHHKYVYESEYIPTSSHSIENVPSSSHPVEVIPSLSRPVEVKPTLSRPVNFKSKPSQHIEVIPTSCHPVERHSFAVDVKTVLRSTCNNCGRDFVRRDHYQRHISKCAKNHRLQGPPEELQSFTCTTCDRKYQRRDHFDRHTKKCAQSNPSKQIKTNEQNHNTNKVSVTVDTHKPPKDQSNTSQQQPSTGQSKNIESSDKQGKFVPEIIDLTDSINQSNSSKYTDVSKHAPSTSSSAPSLTYSNSRDITSHSWLKSLQGSSKVTIINNIKKVNTDRSLTLQNVTDKIVNNLTNERKRNLEKMTLRSIIDENLNQSCNDTNHTVLSIDKNINKVNNDRSMTLQNMTEKLIENYSNELSNMDCYDLMLNKRKKEATKEDGKEQHKSTYTTDNVSPVSKQQETGTSTTKIDILVDNEQDKKINKLDDIYPHDTESNESTIKVEMVDSTVNEINKNIITLENSDVNKERCTIKMECVSSEEENKDMDLIDNTDISYTDQQNSMDVVEDIATSSNKISEPDELVSLFTSPNENDNLSREKEEEFEKKICNVVIGYLKRLYVNNRFQFHKMMRIIFQEQLNDQQFMCWLYKKLL